MMKKSCKAIMFQGTGSDVGKTVLVAGFCRLLRNRGIKVRPFKPQNMSNNAAVADMPGEAGGGEIGRAQWLQALACGVAPSVHMNPVLLKPQSETGSQIIVQGKVWGQAKGRDYQRLKPQLMDAVMQSFDIVLDDADIVLVEGAGSPAEINLRAGDIANMGFATKAGVPVVMVADIDRGGVIASLVGTHVILPDEDRDQIKGYIINKFRGDVSLFDEGLLSIGEFTGWPCFGVVPWLDAVSRLPAEDSVALETIMRSQKQESKNGMVKIAVPVMGHIANFDDLDPLKAEPGIDLVMVRKGDALPEDAALVILPGSKSTIADLLAFRENGWEEGLARHVAKGGHIIGICGGYQMLGNRVLDPGGVEGTIREIDGLGYLDIETELETRKTVRNVGGRFLPEDLTLSGYEIHMGLTAGPDCARSMVELSGHKDGAMSKDGSIMGCYMHGLFSADGFRAHVLASIGAASGGQTHSHMIDQALDDLAADLEKYLNVDALLKLAG